MTWKIIYLQYTNDSDKGVIKARWTCEAVDGNISFSDSGVTTFTPDPSSPDYVAYEDITEAMALEWVWAEVGIETVEDDLQSKINEAKNPTALKGKPW